MDHNLLSDLELGFNLKVPYIKKAQIGVILRQRSPLFSRIEHLPSAFRTVSSDFAMMTCLTVELLASSTATSLTQCDYTGILKATLTLVLRIVLPPFLQRSSLSRVLGSVQK